jgi:hypothetical protein
MEAGPIERGFAIDNQKLVHETLNDRPVVLNCCERLRGT